MPTASRHVEEEVEETTSKAEEKAPESQVVELKGEAEGRIPHLIEGQRVRVKSGDFEGRMAYVLAVDYKDVTQLLLSKAGVPEARFAEAEDYVCRTRDGREDVFIAKPDELEPLEPNNGWGRGTV